MTLVILAAGMGSRYGGMKQIDPITDNGEFIIDFSIFDAIRAGFDRVVFVIKYENLESFRETVGSRIEKHIKVEYAFQSIDDIPNEYRLPENRIKPWGTAHALLSARKIVNDNFAVINADDFYGRDAYMKLAAHLSDAGCVDGVSHSCMIGYILGNTLTENGSVSRGQCYASDGILEKIIERKKIVCGDGTALYENGDGSWTPLPLTTTVSMNCFGFTPDVFGHIYDGFKKFLSKLDEGDITSEYYLPGSVAEMIADGKCTVSLIKTDSDWYGVTYHDDKPRVTAAVRSLVDKGEYPASLWLR